VPVRGTIQRRSTPALDGGAGGHGGAGSGGGRSHPSQARLARVAADLVFVAAAASPGGKVQRKPVTRNLQH